MFGCGENAIVQQRMMIVPPLTLTRVKQFEIYFFLYLEKMKKFQINTLMRLGAIIISAMGGL